MKGKKLKRPKVLTIAGSDSGGGAGIQADLKTFAAHGCYGMSVITALTAQNTLGVTAVMAASNIIVCEQLEAVLSDLGCDAAKTGMLVDAPTIRTVVRGLAKHPVVKLVVDPVMVSKSGHALLSADAVEALKQELLPLAMVATPNLEEVRVLTGQFPGSVAEMEEAARMLGQLGPRAVLVKGGHLDDRNESVDVLWDGKGMTRFSSPRLDAKHTHGTGCTLSAAIAANLALGRTLQDSVREAKSYLFSALKAAYAVGAGIGPVNHLWRLEDQSDNIPDRGGPEGDIRGTTRTKEGRDRAIGA